MAITLAVGTTVAIASTYGTSKTMSAITNASEAVATLEASHGVIATDILEITSGLQRLTNRIVRAKTVSTNDVTLEGINTSSTTNYPAGSGAGSVREITAWTDIGQLTRDISISGGEQQFADVTTLTDVLDQQVPTRRSAISIALPIYFDAALAYVTTVRAAADSATPTAVRFVFPNGTKIYANAYWTYQDFPTIEGDTLRGRIDLALRGASTLYTS